MKILIGSNNIGKIKEYKDLLGPGFDLISLHELGIELDVEETGKTYAENALIKLNAIKDKSDIPILTDDSGLEVRALGDRPGIFSARYSGKNATDESNVDKLIKELSNSSDFTAKFVCTIAFFNPKNKLSQVLCTGECKGTIILERRGDSGFGYDPIFYIKELDKTFAELSADEKNLISHRAIAVKELLKRINI
tara:strand:+ start:7769 stop:8350 length:582 start_codon:yes stop_codon:yes gene_type:complete